MNAEGQAVAGVKRSGLSTGKDKDMQREAEGKGQVGRGPPTKARICAGADEGKVHGTRQVS